MMEVFVCESFSKIFSFHQISTFSETQTDRDTHLSSIFHDTFPSTTFVSPTLLHEG